MSEAAAPVAGTLRVALVQPETVWHDPVVNRARLAATLGAQTLGHDVIVLPETFTTGFSNAATAFAESMDGPTVGWMREQAQRLDAAVTGSVVIDGGRGVVNRLLWVTPDGSVAWYDKRHLFRMAGEHQHFVPGTARLVVSWRGWRICPLVCYDLRFPVFARNGRVAGAPAEALAYDLLVVVANWPAARQRAWQTLLPARAIENLSYVVGVNRVGFDGQRIGYAGASAAYDYLGESLVAADSGVGIWSATLDHAALRAHRARFPAHLDADGFALTE